MEGKAKTDYELVNCCGIVTDDKVDNEIAMMYILTSRLLLTEIDTMRAPSFYCWIQVHLVDGARE